MSEKNGNGHKPKRGRPKGKGNIPHETKAEMVALLPLVGGCNSQVAREFGVDEAVVRRAAADPRLSELSEVKKEQIARKFGQLVDKLLTRYLDIADTATLEDKGATLLGIAADKHRLYAGEPTAITETRRTLSKEEAEATLAEYERRFGADRALSLFREDDPELASTLVQ